VRPVLVETLALASVVLTRHYFGFGHCITNYPSFLDLVYQLLAYVHQFARVDLEAEKRNN
jgi:hypothetical protein